MKIRIITKEDELRGLRAEWNSLLKASCNDKIQLTHEWVAAWWRNFGKDAALSVVVACDDDGAVAGIAPLMLSECKYRNVNLKKLSLMANGHSPSSDFIVENKDPEAVIRSMINHIMALSSWDILELYKVDAGGLTYSVVRDFLESNRHPFGVKANIESPYISIDTDWETFFSSRSKKFKKAIRNKLNRAERSADLSIERIKITKGTDKAIQTMFSISGKSWKKEDGTDLASNPRARGFYHDLCELLGPHGAVDLWLLSKGGQPIAFEFHLTHNKVVYPIRADYDESFKECSPGSVLEYNIIKTLFEEGAVSEYNTCGHTYNYLMNWTDNTRKLANVEIFNKRIRSYTLYNLEYKLIPLLRGLKANKVKSYFVKPSGN